jgi:2'-5' RNA ligase
VRLFVALAVPESARGALVAAVAPLRAAHPDLRWTRPAGWHLTLAFLGAGSVGDRVRAQLAVGRAAATAAPVDLAIDGRLGRFGDRVLWAHVRDRDAGLAALADAVRIALVDHGFAVDDRAFRAHLTLARGRTGQRLPPDRRITGSGVPARWTASTVALIDSRPGADGNRYRAVATWPLGPAAGP